MRAADVSRRGETLTKDEVCRRIGVEGKQLDAMIRRGQFPRGLKPTHKSRPVWPLPVFEAWLLLHPLMTAEGAAGEEESDGGEES